MQDFLVIDQVTKTFGSVRAVDGVSLSIRQGEAFSLLGPSGCGKTTLLRLLAGFEQPDAGRICLGGRDITAQPPERRPVNTVFQNYALFPHLTVWDNIAFGLRMAKRSKAEVRAAVERMLHLVRLTEQAGQRPAQLSGGQRQRVAIARALVNEPQVLLLDEPLAALDLKLRQHMLAELTALHRAVGTAFLYVTHDQGEAMNLSDRIAVLHEGRVEQVAPPVELYESPSSRFVAAFIGDAHFFEGTVQANEVPGQITVAAHDFGVMTVTDPGSLAAGTFVRVMVRPERFNLTSHPAAPSSGVNAWRGKIENVSYFGAYSRIGVRCGNHVLQVQCPAGQPWQAGEETWLTFAAADARVLEN